MCLLLIEGSPRLRKSLAERFRRAGYEVEVVGDVERGLVSAQRSRHDIILLDAALPDTDWLELVRRFRAEGTSARIILLTPRYSVADCVSGLNSGADDYVAKPFSFEELLARVRVLLRGPHRSRSSGTCVEDLAIDTDDLTRRELRIL